MIDLSSFSYVLAAVLFILGIKKLSHPKTARDGNFLSAFGMLIAIVATLIFYSELIFSTSLIIFQVKIVHQISNLTKKSELKNVKFCTTSC